ncbi:MAG: sulfatase [Planctomycetota bacterium]|nr:sulfatase [Planctomycetota bacterium]
MSTPHTLPGLTLLGTGCFLALAVFPHCTSVAASEPDESSTGVIRLGALLSSARIDSPLSSIQGAADIDDLTDLVRTLELDETFEAFDPDEAGWRMEGSSAVESTEDGQAFVLRGLGGRARYGWVIPAEPSTHYVFRRRIKTAGETYADFAVVEAKSEGRISVGGPFANHYMAGRGLALKVHWPAAPEADNEWHTASASFFTTPNTHSLAVILRQRVSQIAGRGQVNALSFDDIRLERVEPSPEQAIALLKARSPASGSDPTLGIEKFGQFPPLGEVGETHGPRDDNYSYRYGLYAPPRTDLGFSMHVPAQASLKLSACLSRETSPGDAARFEVLAVMDGEETSLWSHDAKAELEGWIWERARVDLGPWSGLEIELVLRTTSLKGHPHPIWGNPSIETPPTGKGPTNVILIAVDTLRADRLSCYGYERPTTPHLDALAADGVRFESAVSNCNWTCPSFASIFTGLVPSRHGVFSYGSRTPLPETLLTLAERFRNAGWATQSVVYKPPLYDGGFEQGFDVAHNVPREAVRAEDNLAEALQWLEDAGPGRNYLFLHFNDPHQPFTQPAPFDRAFGGDPSKENVELPYSIYQDGYPRSEKQRNVMRFLYDGEVNYVDDRIGAFLAALKERGLYDDAVIGFVSDHGEQLWEHGGFGHGPSFGGGDALFDEVVHVPLIIKPGAGKYARGTVVKTQVRGFDVTPTLMELAGLAEDADMDARSLAPFLKPDAKEAPDRIAVVETSGNRVALRNQNWKYVLTYSSSPKENLYDLQSDPGETEDVAEQNTEVVSILRMQVLEYLLVHRPGTYLVANAGVRAGDEDLQVAGIGSPTSFAGLRGKDRKSKEYGALVEFSGESSSPLLLVCGVTLTGPVGVVGGEALPTESVRYQLGDLQALLHEPTPTWRLYRGPDPILTVQPQQQTMDARHLEAMRALGYGGDDEDS